MKTQCNIRNRLRQVSILSSLLLLSLLMGCDRNHFQFQQLSGRINTLSIDSTNLYIDNLILTQSSVVRISNSNARITISELEADSELIISNSSVEIMGSIILRRKARLSIDNSRLIFHASSKNFHESADTTGYINGDGGLVQIVRCYLNNKDGMPILCGNYESTEITFSDYSCKGISQEIIRGKSLRMNIDGLTMTDCTFSKGAIHAECKDALITNSQFANVSFLTASMENKARSIAFISIDSGTARIGSCIFSKVCSCLKDVGALLYISASEAQITNNIIRNSRFMRGICMRSDHGDIRMNYVSSCSVTIAVIHVYRCGRAYVDSNIVSGCIGNKYFANDAVGSIVYGAAEDIEIMNNTIVENCVGCIIDISVLRLSCEKNTIARNVGRKSVSVDVRPMYKYIIGSGVIVFGIHAEKKEEIRISGNSISSNIISSLWLSSNMRSVNITEENSVTNNVIMYADSRPDDYTEYMPEVLKQLEKNNVIYYFDIGNNYIICCPH